MTAWHHRRIVLGALVISLVLGANCAARAEDTLVVGQAGDPLTLDPHANPGLVEASVMSNLFDTLIIFDKNMQIQSGLAVSWENPEPDRWIFHLRKGVKFHNGADLTASDVKYSIERVKNWKPYGGNTGVAFYLNGVDTVTALDPLTVEIRTKGPFGPMLRSLRAIYIVNKEYVEKLTAEKGVEVVGHAPMGTGAFKFVEWVPGDHVTMEGFDGWWAGKAGVERVVFRQIANNATRTAALLSGEIQIATELPPRDVQRVKDSPIANVTILEGMRTVNFRFDTVREKTPGVPGMPNPLRDLRVREAINYAIDTGTIIKVVMNGFASPAEQLAGHQHFGWSPNIKHLPYDPTMAKKLLAEAGFPHGFPLQVDSTNNRYVNDEQICLAVAQMLTKVEIKATCRARSKQIAFAEFNDKRILCCSMYIFSFVTPTADLAGNLETNLHTPTADGTYGASNGGDPSTPRYSNPEADKLIEAAGKETNEAKRQALLQRASETIMANYPLVPLHYQNDIYGILKKVAWTPKPDQYLTVSDATWR